MLRERVRYVRVDWILVRRTLFSSLDRWRAFFTAQERVALLRLWHILASISISNRCRSILDIYMIPKELQKPQRADFK